MPNGAAPKTTTATAWLLPLALAGVYLSWLPLSSVHGFFSDDAVFLLLADYFSADAPSPLLNFVREQSHFPTLFPLLLSALGAGSDSPLWASAVNRGLLLASLGALAFFLNRQGAGRWPQALCLTLLVLLPATTLLALELWSEFLFMVFAYAALALGRRDEQRGAVLLLAGFLVILACLTRAAGVSLLAAYWLFLLINRCPSRYRLIGGTAMLAVLCLGATSGLSRFGWYFSTGADAAGSIDWQQWPALIGARLVHLFQAWHWQFDPLAEGSVADRLFAALLLALAGIGLAVRLLQRQLDALWVVAYLAMLIIWPFQHPLHLSRFVYPLVPVLLFQALVWPGAALATSRLRMPAQVAVIALFLGLSTTPLFQFQARLLAERPAELRAFSHNRWWLMSRSEGNALDGARLRRDVIQGLQAARQRIGEQDCVYAAQSPLVMLHTRRITGVFTPTPPGQAPPEAALGQCGSMIASPMVGSELDQTPYYPAALVNPDKYRIEALPDSSHHYAILLFQRR